MWEEYRDAAQHCGEKIHVTKPHLGLKMARTVGGNWKRGFKYINSERHWGSYISPLQDEDLTNRVTAPAWESSRSGGTMLSGTWCYSWNYLVRGQALDFHDPCRSLPIQVILWFCNSACGTRLHQCTGPYPTAVRSCLVPSVARAGCKLNLKCTFFGRSREELSEMSARACPEQNCPSDPFQAA